MFVLGVIPARGGSKTIPRKNIYPLLGKPLIYYSIKAAKESTLIDDCIVSTDDLEIKNIAIRLKTQVRLRKLKATLTTLSRSS